MSFYQSGGRGIYYGHPERRAVLPLARAAIWDVVSTYFERSILPMSDKSNQQNAIVLLNLLLAMCEFFRDQRGLLYAAFSENERRTVSPVDSAVMRGAMQRVYFMHEQKALSHETAQQVIELLEALQINVPVQQVHLRTAFVDGALYYDLKTQHGDVVRIDEKGCCIDRNFLINFLRPANLSTQVLPDLTASSDEFFPLVRRHFRTGNDHDALMMAAYIAALFVDGIAHPVLSLWGQMGAAKSTTMEHIGKVFSPGNDARLTLPTSTAELARIASRFAFVGFDNTEQVKPKIANLLCQIASPNGTYTTRKKYTDGEDVFFDLRARVAMTGLSVCSTRRDWLDRLIVVELESICPEHYLEDEAVEEVFQADLPKFLGSCFRVLSKALAIHPTVKCAKMRRMASFYKWGVAITLAMGMEQRAFEDAYEANIQSVHELVTEMDISVECLKIFLQRQHEGGWKGRWLELYGLLRHIALENNLLESKSFLGSAASLSKHIRSIQSDLKAVGISAHFGYQRKNKIVSFNLDNVGSPVQTNGDGFKPDDSDSDELNF